jgi:hypothetical protein
MNIIGDVKIPIQGVSTMARGKGVGNEFVSAGLLRMGMDGGSARIYIEYKEEGKVEGTAVFKLEKDEAVKLINGLKQIYNLEAT